MVDPVEKRDGVPVFERPPRGFTIVVEGRPGGTGAALGVTTFLWDPEDPTVLPDLWVESSQPLGDGNPAVCDGAAPVLGGVPAVEPPDFSIRQEIANALNDFGCRFRDGSGAPRGVGPAEACTYIDDSFPGFVADDSTLQFCGTIDTPMRFPRGETQITVRIRDVAGNVSAPSTMIVRVAE